MCRRGGSKGGMQSARMPGTQHQKNTAHGNARELQTGRKQPGGRNTHRAFFVGNLGQIWKPQRKQGKDYPCGKIKIL